MQRDESTVISRFYEKSPLSGMRSSHCNRDIRDCHDHWHRQMTVVDLLFPFHSQWEAARPNLRIQTGSPEGYPGVNYENANANDLLL